MPLLPDITDVSGLLRKVPSLGACVALFRLRRRLPDMLEAEPLDVLLGRLSAGSRWRRRPLHRERLEVSISATEAVLTRLGLASNTCLYRSMGRYALLRSHGIPVIFVMGIGQPPDTATGHAWLEDDAGPYREKIKQDQYIVTFCHPPDARPASDRR